MATRLNERTLPRSTCRYCPGACAAPLDHRVDASPSTARAASALFSDAVAVAWASESGFRVVRSACEAGHVKVASEPPGNVYSNVLSPTATANDRGSSFSL